MRIILIILIILGSFAGGFLTGVEYHEHDMVQNPHKYVDLYKKEITTNAKDKIKKLKSAVREKLED